MIIWHSSDFLKYKDPRLGQTRKRGTVRENELCLELHITKKISTVVEKLHDRFYPVHRDLSQTDLLFSVSCISYTDHLCKSSPVALHLQTQHLHSQFIRFVSSLFLDKAFSPLIPSMSTFIHSSSNDVSSSARLLNLFRYGFSL